MCVEQRVSSRTGFVRTDKTHQSGLCYVSIHGPDPQTLTVNRLAEFHAGDRSSAVTMELPPRLRPIRMRSLPHVTSHSPSRTHRLHPDRRRCRSPNHERFRSERRDYPGQRNRVGRPAARWHPRHRQSQVRPCGRSRFPAGGRSRHGRRDRRTTESLSHLDSELARGGERSQRYSAFRGHLLPAVRNRDRIRLECRRRGAGIRRLGAPVQQ